MTRKARIAAAVTAFASLGGCDLSMRDQPRASAQGSARLWPDGPPRSAPPAGTIATDAPARDAALATPPPLTAALIERGQQQYGIFCAVCHGARGDGDGTVVRRGFPQPPSFHEPRLVAAPASHVVDVVTRGRGVMYSYADRVAPADRWAIAAYVRALQRARTDEAGR